MAILTSLENAIKWLEEAKRELQQTTDLEKNSPPSSETVQIAWGSKVSPVFKERVLWIADNLGCSPNDLMACLAWESAETFRADIKNAAGSGATGLIQFMPSTARGLGTTTAALAEMTPEDQLRYVYKYFQPYAGRLHNLGDIYAAILWPKGVGKPDHYIYWSKKDSPITYRQNKGLDTTGDGIITKAEATAKVQSKLAKGLSPENIG